MRQLLAALLLTATLPAFAQPYVALGFTAATIEQGQRTAQEFDRAGVMPHLALGYQLTDAVSLEASWYAPDQLGHYHSRVVAGPATTTTSVAQELDGLRVAALLRTRLSANWHAFGSLSLYFLEGESASASTTEQGGMVIASSASTTQGRDTLIGLGAGLEYQLTPGAAVRATLEGFNASGKVFGDGLGSRRVYSGTVAFVKRF